ncbi:unnamed protein product [Paramecium octaurelia]|uniref:Rab-GAP TBC domain-containing protein n=1 Tax=Paramecium octaurelia TaxID=43137 RepID=A0A8S1WA22_PAROT|nr:unnamed protein product [Paramecium octaurelia]
MWLTKSYSFIKTRIDYHIRKPPQVQEGQQEIVQQPSPNQKCKQRSVSANSKMKINIIKDFYKLSKDDQYIYNSIEINDITFIEQATKDNRTLEKNDWQIILKNKSFSGYKVQQIHQSIMLQTMEYDIRRQWWIFVSNQEQNKKELRNQSYQKLKKADTLHKIQIEKDVARTIIHDMFKQHENQQSLKNILIAYANYDKELGYVQGLNIIVANLLVCYDLSVNDQQLNDFEVMDEERDETVFFIFLYIMKDQNWRVVFLEGFEGLRLKIDVLEQMMKKKIPELHKHFYDEGITDFFPFLSRFYMTLLMYNIPWRFSGMILDLFLIEGEEIIHKLILAMLSYHKNMLITRNYSDIRLFCQEQLVKGFLEIFDASQPNLMAILQKLNLL